MTSSTFPDINQNTWQGHFKTKILYPLIRKLSALTATVETTTSSLFWSLPSHPMESHGKATEMEEWKDRKGLGVNTRETKSMKCQISKNTGLEL